MSVNQLDRKIAEIEQRVAILRDRWPDVPRGRPHPSEPFDQALNELSTRLEDIHVLHEELQHRNEELGRAHEAIAIEKRRYQELFAFAPDGYLVTDRSGNLLEANRAAHGILQPRRMLPGFPLRSYIVPQDRPRFDALLQQAVQQDQPIERELRIRSGRAPERSCVVRVAPVFDAEGRPTGLRWMVRDVTEQKALERQAAEAVQREQQRIGREVHDGLCQQLAAVEMLATCVRVRLAGKLPEEAGAMDELIGYIRDSFQQARLLSRGLVPLQLEAHELCAALKSLADSVSACYGVQCRVVCERPPELDNAAAANHLFRIVQEATHNALRHGQATQIVTSIDRDRDKLTVSVRDNGLGLPKSHDLAVGLGLRTMRYRASLIGGDFEIGAAPGGGTQVTCRLNCTRLRARPPAAAPDHNGATLRLAEPPPPESRQVG